MAGGRGIRAGRAFVELFADDSKLVRGLRNAGRRVKAWGASIAGVGAGLAGFGVGIVGSLVGMAKSFADAGDTIDKMSARTGVSAEALSGLKFAAEQSGSSLETVENGVKGMQRSLLDADLGLSTATDSLQRLGVSAAELRAMSPEEQFKTLADAVAAVEGPGDKAALAMKLFGRAGQELVPLLSGGRKGIEELMAEAESLGIVLSSDQTKAAAKFTDAWNRVKQQLGGVVLQIGGAVAPMLTNLSGKITKVMKHVIDWIKQNKGLIVSAFKIGVAIAAAGAALVAVGIVVASVGAAIGGIATVITTVGAVFGTVASIVAGVFSAAMSIAATAIGLIGSAVALVFSPLGLLIAAVVGLGAIFVKTTETGKQAMGEIAGLFTSVKDTAVAAFKKVASFLSEKFEALKETATTAFGGIVDALKAGDIQLAGKILWLGLKAIWMEGIMALTEIWVGFKRTAVETAIDLAKGIMESLGVSVTDIVDMWSSLEKAWVELTSFLSMAWHTFLAGFQKAWNKAQGVVAKGFINIMVATGQLDPELAGDAKSQIDNETNSKNRQIDENRNRQITGIEQRRSERLGGIDEKRAGRIAGLESLLDKLGHNQKFDKELAAVRADLEAAKAELNASVAEAGKKADAATKTGEEGKKAGGSGEGLAGKVSAGSIGSFSARTIAGMSFGRSPETETAKNTKAMLAEQQKTNKQLKGKNGVQFA